ncbi:MAG TPA: cupin domain-containing protein, partial [Anaerolineales bacterium]|nr:cupin domain-containing protein [Anaerolineales bacterium]
VLEGAIRQMVAGQEFLLNAGDSIHYLGQNPHCWANALTDQPTEAILVLAPRDDRERPVERHLPPNDSTKPGATLPDKEHS